MTHREISSVNIVAIPPMRTGGQLVIFLLIEYDQLSGHDERNLLNLDGSLLQMVGKKSVDCTNPPL